MLIALGIACFVFGLVIGMIVGAAVMFDCYLPSEETELDGWLK